MQLFFVQIFNVCSLIYDNLIWPVVNTWANIEDLIFMQDGTPPHFAIVVREWLNEHFLG